jgi:hypothetical protein
MASSGEDNLDEVFKRVNAAPRTDEEYFFMDRLVIDLRQFAIRRKKFPTDKVKPAQG